MLTSLGLPTTYAPDAFDELLATMGLDKKTRGSTLRFVLLDDVASAQILPEIGQPEWREDVAHVAPSARQGRAGEGLVIV